MDSSYHHHHHQQQQPQLFATTDQPPHLQHPPQNAPWYPSPPPPPPPPHHHQFPPYGAHHPPPQQWGPPPPPYAPQQQWAPPPPQGYQPPPQQQQQWAPQQQQDYPPPPPNQQWASPQWGQHQAWQYPDINTSYSNEEDWANKAKAWAAANSSTMSHQTQPHEHYQLPAGVPTENSHQSLPQSSNQQFPVHLTDQWNEANYLHDKGRLASPGGNVAPLPSAYEKEVSYNYSYAPVNTNTSVQHPDTKVQPPPAASILEGFPQALHPMPIKNSPLNQPYFAHNGHPCAINASDRPLEFVNKAGPDVGLHQSSNFGHAVPAAPVGLVDRDAIPTSALSWIPSASSGFLPPAPLSHPGTQLDPSILSQPSLPMQTVPLFGGVSGASYGPGIPPAPFGVGVTPLHPPEAFPADINGFSLAERPKKGMPNWLREELLKNKSMLASNTVQQPGFLHSVGSEITETSLKRVDQSDTKSVDSAKSTEDDNDDEDEVEVARMAEVNREIKRVLTEILLKVTDDLFDEIATKILDEDELTVELSEPIGSMSPAVPDSANSTPKVSARILVPAKAISIKASGSDDDDDSQSSPKGALLGLANYASGDDDDDNDDGDVDKGSGKGMGKQSSVTEKEEETLGMQEIASREGKDSSQPSANFSEDNNNPSPLHHETSPKRENKKVEDLQNELPLDDQIAQPKHTVPKKDENALEVRNVAAIYREPSTIVDARESKNIFSNHRYSEKRENMDNSVEDGKAVETKRQISKPTSHMNHEDKPNMMGRIDKRDSLIERSLDGSSRHEVDVKDSYSRGISKHENTKEDIKHAKDTRDRNKDTDRREKAKDQKDDRSREVTKGSAIHSSKRSPSPRGRSRTHKENSHVQGSISSEERSDKAKRRKLHSERKSLSPSPPKSRDRKISRSPHSKHSHRRHSPYTLTERRRRSRTPVKRR